MQYKIPIQIENEDVIVLNLSLRQLVIMMVWGGIGYTIFKNFEPKLGPQVALVFGAIPALIGIIIALVKIAEMTFLPAALNFFRLSLNAKTRMWSQGTDGYSDMEVGYVAMNTTKASAEANTSIESEMEKDEKINQNILKL